MTRFYCFIQNNIFFLIVACCITIAKLLLCSTCFFWDTISLISVPANYLFETKFASLLYPPEINITLATFPQMYTALVWSIFGRTLLITHLAYLPFVLMFAYQLYSLCKRFSPKDFLPYVYLFVLLDTTIFTQILLLTPDLFLLAFAAWSLNNLLTNKKIFLSCSLFLLATVSDRGMILSGVLILFHFIDVLFFQKLSLRSAVKSFLIYLPTLCFCLFLVFVQKNHSGYFLINTDEKSPWSEHWHFVDFYGFVRNLLVATFRCVENGHLFVLIMLAFVVIRTKGKVAYNRSLLFLCALFLSVMAFCTLPFRNPINTRYFAFLFMIFSIFAAGVLIKSMPRVAKTFLVVLTILAVMSNLIVYPEKMAQSWDSSLAHLPYYKLREQVKDFFSEQNVDYAEVGTSFPLLQTFENTDLTDDSRSFSSIDFDNNRFVIYTNISNLNDDTIDKISEYPCVKSFQKNGIFMNIHKIR